MPVDSHQLQPISVHELHDVALSHDLRPHNDAGGKHTYYDCSRRQCIVDHSQRHSIQTCAHDSRDEERKRGSHGAHRRDAVARPAHHTSHNHRIEHVPTAEEQH